MPVVIYNFLDGGVVAIVCGGERGAGIPLLFFVGE